MDRRGTQFLRTAVVLAIAWSVQSAHAGDPPVGPKKTTAQPTPAKKPAGPAARGTSKTPPATSSSRPNRVSDPNVRRQVAGGSTTDDVAVGAESAELRALHEAERELFPPAAPAMFAPWPNELPSPLSATGETPHVHASGLPPAPVPSTPPAAEGGKDLSWMAHLQLPELPVRWEPRLVRYLEFFKDDPRGRTLLTIWLKRSGRYREAIRKVLRRKGVPEDLLWLAMIESGFDAGARSPVGASGLWQFMPETGRQYGLMQDRWADQRLNAMAATEAATEFLADLHRRFGSWELAIAAYNMGYAGVLSVVRRYNTNDFWALSRLEGALPWETTLYVPKIIAASIVARNLAIFGYADLAVESPFKGEEINVPGGTSLASVASAAQCSTKEVEQLNLELRASRTPPLDAESAAAGYPVRVPIGKSALATQNLAKLKRDQPPLEKYVVRFGESLEQIATARGVSVSRLIEVNGITQGEVVRGGTVLLLPPAKSVNAASVASLDVPVKPVVVVPADIFVYPDRKRVFYRVVVGDTLRDVSSQFHVSVDDLRRWNEIDPSGRLQEGMTLQLFVPTDADLSKVVVVGENDVRTISAGTDDFFTYWEAQKGRKRVTVTAKAGDTLEALGRRYGLSTASMERINRRAAKDAYKEGDAVVLYLPNTSSVGAGAAAGSGDYEPEPLGALPSAPAPGGLPQVR
jgi:membrane-bound lytic murein transglycosylase D